MHFFLMPVLERMATTQTEKANCREEKLMHISKRHR